MYCAITKIYGRMEEDFFIFWFCDKPGQQAALLSGKLNNMDTRRCQKGQGGRVKYYPGTDGSHRMIDVEANHILAGNEIDSV